MRRFCCGLGLTLATLLALGPAAAFACLEPRLDVPSSAYAGDQVEFTITDTTPGAEYTVEVNGTVVARGISTGGARGATGTFTMPNLGPDPMTVYAKSTTAHDDIEGGRPYPSEQPMRYLVAPPADPPPDDPPGDGPGGDPGGEENRGEGSGQTDTPGGQRASPTGDEGRSDPAASPIAAPEPRATPLPQLRAGEPPSAEESERAAVSAQAGTADQQEAEGPRALGVPLPEWVDDDTQIGPVAVPNLGLAAIVAIFVLGTLAVSLVFYLAGRLAPDPKRLAVEVGEALTPAVIEAELQEMIAEERARRLLSEPPATPGSSDTGSQIPTGA